MKAKTNKLKKLQNIRRHLKLAVIPHKENHYRPHLVRRYGLLIVFAFVVAFQAGYNFFSTGAILGEATTIDTVELFEQTNEERKKHAIKPLQFDERLSEAAHLKAQDMFSRQYWAHTAPDGTTPWYWLKEVDYRYAYAGENLAKDFRSDQGVLAAWMNSNEHRQNVLNTRFSQVGFAVVDGVLNGKATTLIVGLYGAPADHTVVGSQTAPGVAAESGSVSVASQFGVMLRSLPPTILGLIAILIVLTGTALLAHAYRNKLPKNLRQSWYRRHHGLIKSGGMLSLIVIMILLYSGGQI